MSETVRPAQKPSIFWPLFTAAVAFGLFSMGVYYMYAPQRPAAIHHGTRTPEERREVLAEHRTEAQAALSSYAWIDQARGTVQLPIERAMELTVQEFKSGANNGNRR